MILFLFILLTEYFIIKYINNKTDIRDIIIPITGRLYIISTLPLLKALNIKYDNTIPIGILSFY